MSSFNFLLILLDAAMTSPFSLSRANRRLVVQQSLLGFVHEFHTDRDIAVDFFYNHCVPNSGTV